MANCDNINDGCDDEFKFALYLREFPIIYSKSSLSKDIGRKREAWNAIAEEFKTSPDKLKKDSKHDIKNEKDILYFRDR